MIQRDHGKSSSVYRFLDLNDQDMQVIASFLSIVLRDTLQFADYVSVVDGMTGEISGIG